MIPATNDPNSETDVVTAPTVKSNDRISVAEDVTAVTSADGAPELKALSPEGHAPDPESVVKVPKPDSAVDGNMGSAPIVRIEPSEPHASVSPEPATQRIEPSLAPLSPRGSSEADAPTIMIAPTPRAVTPPPLPTAAMPPPQPAMASQQASNLQQRQSSVAEAYAMPSTIAPTEQKKKRSRFRSKAARSSVVVVFDGLMSLATIIALLLWVTAFAGMHEFDLPGPLAASAVVVIPAKKSRDEIGDILQDAGVVSTGWVFVYGSAIAQLSDLKAGEYEFRPHESMREVAEELQQNKVVQHKITFPEGWTSEQIVQRLIDDPVLTGKIVAIPEEGSLLPDTYTFPRGETRQQILDLMRKNQERRLTEIWAHRNADMLKELKVPKDLVILASIIEKETSKPEERARISAVFVNRLNRGMRLETDPTILYGLYGGKAWSESRTITKADLLAPNPYNTYKINGLPPGPIGNPGRASLEAAAKPLQTNELFFVADGTGGHAFAETLEEHNKNVLRWREIERQRKASDSNGAAAAIPGSGTGVQAVQAGSPATTLPAPAKPTAPKPRVKVQPAVPQTQDQPPSGAN